MCANDVSYVNIWSREGVPSVESVSLPFVTLSAAQAAVDFQHSTFLQKISSWNRLVFQHVGQ